MKSDRIDLSGGKYTIINNGAGGFEFLRHGETRPAGNELRFSNVVVAMFHRIQDLEEECNRLAASTAPVQAQGVLTDGRAAPANFDALVDAEVARRLIIAIKEIKEEQQAQQASDALDAARYRWLRAVGPQQQNVIAHYAMTCMDAVIDAALKEQKMAQELKPCPFCGCHVISVTTHSQKQHTFKCEDCPGGAEFRSSDLNQATEAWNRRVVLTPNKAPQ